MDSLNLPLRTRKPRSTGLTAIMDIGLPLAELRAILEDYHDLLDIAKLGIGSAYVTRNLSEKLALYRQYDIVPYFGGTLFEKFFSQGKFGDYLDFLRTHEVTWIEISCGTIPIPLEQRIGLVQRVAKDLVPLAEVGVKDSAAAQPNEVWLAETEALLEAGCRYVIAEGRNTATAGIYDSDGEPRHELIDDLVEAVGAERLIFEAPTSASRLHFINLLGANVNLGNIAPRDILSLESERCGLRCETFFLETA